jgi:hypothetical protein
LNPLGNVVALARRPTRLLQAILYPEELVKLAAAARTRTSTLFEGFFDPAPPAPPAPPDRPTPVPESTPVEPAPAVAAAARPTDE